MHGEAGALYSESATYQGLSYYDKLFNLWDPSWAKVDRSVLESNRQAGIQKELERQKAVGKNDNPKPQQ
jgi:hypothetical protein